MSQTPIKTLPPQVKISRNAGSHRSSFGGWQPRQVATYEGQEAERALSQNRAADLVANDWAASSGVNAITANAVGVGLKPQSRLNAKRLGISIDEALELQNNIEAIWKEWVTKADVRGLLHFEDLQLLGLRSLLRQGELLHLPVMLKDPGRNIKLAIQAVQPNRLLTPFDKKYNSSIVDGVELGPYGKPEKYWIATPSKYTSFLSFKTLVSSQFTALPAKIGHRPGVFHLFRHNEEEQVRGESVFQTGMNLFRHLSDSLDNELLAQVVTASMAMFIAQEDSSMPLPQGVREFNSENAEEKQYYQEVVGGTVMYGNKNEKPYMLESSRPSPNFASFSEFVIRAMAASIDLSYEVVAKDFSKTNYSSARAALLEAWRVYMIYRDWLVRHYCQPTWSMVIEEAWLSDQLVFPSSAPDFYDAMNLYTQAMWLGPARGHIDPVKEIKATVTALENHLMTYSEAIAEGGRDFDEVMDEREEEERRLKNFRENYTGLTDSTEAKEVAHAL